MNPRSELVRQLAVYAGAAIDSIPSIAELMAADAPIAPPSPELLDWLQQHRPELLAWLSDVAQQRSGLADEWQTSPHRALAKRFIRWLLRRNPYLAISPADQAALDAVMLRTLAGLRRALATEASILAILEAATRALRSELAGVIRDAFGALIPHDVTCATYSIALQREVLGLDAIELREPILDLGCGPRAELVTTLRGQGLLAEGLDRDVELDAPWVTSADWLAHLFSSSHYGTIISHQGFSLHFLHAHLAPGEGARRYATKYMQLLAALRPGGRFVYSPGLPFIEELLPAQYAVTRRPVPEGLAGLLTEQMARLVGQDVLYAAVVERVR